MGRRFKSFLVHLLETLRDHLIDEPLVSLAAIRPSSESSSVPRVRGLTPSARALLIQSQLRDVDRPALVICSSPRQLEQMREDLEELLGEERVMTHTGWGIAAEEWSHPAEAVVAQRLEMMVRLHRGEPLVVVTTWEELLARFSKVDLFLSRATHLRQGDHWDPLSLSQKLLELGFKPEPMVEEVGEFSQRGGIVDLYPFLQNQPLRIDLMGDGVETIRPFDIFSQRSVGKIEGVEIYPLGELVWGEEEMRQGIARISKELGEAWGVREEERLLRRSERAGLSLMRPWFFPSGETLIELFPSAPLLFLEEEAAGFEKLREIELYWKRAWEAHRAAERAIAPLEELIVTPQRVEELIGRCNRIDFSEVEWGGRAQWNFHCEEQQRTGSGIAAIEEKIEEFKERGVELWLLAPNEGQAEQLIKLTRELPIAGVLVGQLRSGVLIEEEGRAWFTDHQLFNRLARRVRRRQFRGGTAIPDLSKLSPGDFVVHLDYGVGRFIGIKKERFPRGGSIEMLNVEYAGGTRLGVPVEDLFKLEKLTSSDGKPPVLDRIGGKGWENTKSRARAKAHEVARDLVELYAKREKSEGFAFPKDGEAQREFEAAFEWEPTPDQAQAAEAGKRDMEKKIPMDRLVCGDVGFGKTEVAMRLAFKALSANKQVALLVPTTLLAAQHYQSFVDRFSGWPVRIELLNRYRTPKEKKRVLDELTSGAVDIVVGTHALLSDKVKFKELGLLVIDEEQKFGVRQKERLRELRLEVDTLSMTATPIPRTLHLSLSGVRDISLVQTPPRNRLPVETRVVPKEPQVIIQALRYELERGGQSFVVAPQISHLPPLVEMIEKLLPEARVCVAHGQMEDRALEHAMAAFTAGEFDILVSTGIIESGIDIPSVNTIVIDRAHYFGISQLYQLRGRVGRSSIQAQALMLIPEDGEISSDAEERLRAMERFTDLGSGFKLAMRDLEIRGAGNLLGTEQSGFLAGLGLETYLRLVQEAVAELTGKEAGIDRFVRVETVADAFLPEDYVEDGLQRIAIYQRISRITEIEACDDLRLELKDRFGELPAPASTLVDIVVLRLSAALLGFDRVEVGKYKLVWSWSPEREPSAKELSDLLANCPSPIRLLYHKPLQSVVELSTATPTEWVFEASQLLRKLSGN